MGKPNLRHRQNAELFAAAVINSYNSGLTIRQSAEVNGVGYSFAYQNIKRHCVIRSTGQGSSERFKSERERFYTPIKEMHASGKTVKDMMSELKLGRGIIMSCMTDLGIEPHALGARTAERFRRVRSKHYEAVSAMLSEKETVKSIADSIGISRAMVYAVIKDLGLTAPDISQANKLAAQKLSTEARKQRSEKARFSASKGFNGTTFGRSNAVKKQASLSYVGIGETEVAEMLAARGFECVPQFAWDRYNIDIMVGNLAVEVHNLVANPFTATRNIVKTIKMLRSGLNVVFLCFHKHHPITDAAIDQIVAFHDLTSGNPTAFGQYRMIRGNGQIIPNTDRYINELTDVIASYHSFKTYR